MAAALASSAVAAANASAAANSSLRQATTIIAMAPLAVPRKGFDYEILMMKRSEKSRFMGGAHVFPGGVLEPGDAHIDWKLRQPRDVQLLTDMDHRVGGIRELFEECNVLLTKPPFADVDALSEWRQRVQKDAGLFAEMCKAISAQPDVMSLYPWSRWVTPVHEKYRYDTYFYVASLPPRNTTKEDWRTKKAGASTAPSSTPQHQESEASRLDWFTPLEALEGFKQQQVWLPPPTYTCLTELAAYPRRSNLLAMLASNSRSMIPLLPHFIHDAGESKDGVAICYPGDEAHPESLGSGRRNRLHMRGKYAYTLERSVPPQPAPAIPSRAKL